MKAPMIICRGLGKTYRKGNTTVTPLENLDLEVPEGQFLALMGPSGSGKTTLLNLISGIDSPSSGTLEVAGSDISKLKRGELTRWRARNVGYIFQQVNTARLDPAEFRDNQIPVAISIEVCRLHIRHPANL